VKKNLLFKMLGVVLSLSLLVMALPASLALAATIDTAEIINTEGTPSTNPYYGEAVGETGDSIEVTGIGDGGTEIDLYFSSQDAEVGDEIDDEVLIYEKMYNFTIAGGMGGDEFEITTLEIPDRLTDGDANEDVHDGVYYFYFVRATDTAKNIWYVVEFEIVGNAESDIDIDEGPVGTTVTITGSGIAPNEALMVKFDGQDISGQVGDPFADEDGAFEVIFDIPESENGAQNITIAGEDSRAEFEFVFTVLASIVVSPTEGKSGTVLTIGGTGFDYKNGVVFYFGGDVISSTDITWVVDGVYKRTNSVGSFTVTMKAPDSLGARIYVVKAEDEDDDDIYAEAQFTVTLDSVITLDEDSGNVGDEIEVSGVEFSSGDTVTIYFDDAVLDTATTLANGSFTFLFDIPESIAGEHTIKAGMATATVTVEPEIALDIASGSGGTEVTITGTGFDYRSDIETIEFDGTSVGIESGDDRSGDNGSFEFSIIVPTIGAGKYDVTVEDEDGNTASAEFTIVAATASITPVSGAGGTEITVTGANFVAGATVTIYYDGTSVKTTPAGSDGTVSVKFNAPVSAGGTHTVMVSDGANSTTAEFLITAEASMTPTSGNVGSSIAVSGNGFGASRPITITYDGSVVTPTIPIMTLTDGSFSGSFTAPVSTGGSHTVTVSDGTTTKTFTFIMETTLPGTPQQLLPYGSSRPTQPITFDWSDVTDASMPVTYSFQIATDANYSSLVISKTGLTDSTYTLTEAEELDSVSKDNPYHWRVKSTDAAGNSSDWGPSGTFYIGTTWPGWLMWLWIGLGALVLGIFFFWLGRRIAFSSY
jgi:hypothetical protein